MANPYQNTSNTDTSAVPKAALITDLNSSYLSKEQYSHARNVVRNSKEGDLGTISTEPSTIKCYSAPYKIIGAISIAGDKELIFSTDNVSSEIGVGDRKRCTYKKVLNLACLNFNDKFPITGEAKKDFQKGVIVVFTDKNNPARRAELNKLAKIINCDDLLLFKHISQPCITTEKGTVGNMPNGSYSVAIAYSVNNEVFTDWFAISNRIQLFSETGSNSLDITITSLDQEFTKYILCVIGNYVDPTTKGVTKVAKKIGQFSTKTSKVSISDFINPSYSPIELSSLVVKKKTWNKVGIVSSNQNYLILGDLVGRPEQNYQLKAMSITAEYVVEQVEATYYEKDGVDVGHYRDENYDYYINGVYTSGENTDKFHMGGRKATAADRAIVSSADVYEYDVQFSDCKDPGKVENWQVNNTAGKMTPYNNKFFCNRRVLGHGKLGYHESTELYPDPFGPDAGTPIRFHKMPDESIVPRTSIINGKTYINIIGVRFSNIPKFDDPDIVGYKITRSDRKGGNGTVVARGIMTNVRSYTDSALKETVLYSNYGVNNLAADQFLSSTQTTFKNKREHDFTPLTDYLKDKFNFYSPHTSFDPKYSLGNELKVEAEEIATVSGKFELVHNHPRLKLMNQFAFWLAAAVGAIEAGLILIGKTNINGTSGTFEAPPLVLPFGKFNSSSTGLQINSVEDLISLPISKVINMAVTAATSLDLGSVISIINLLKAVIETIAALGLKAAYSVFQGLVTADQVLNIINDFTGFTDYVYQYNAHALFTRSIPVPTGDRRRRLIRPATYLPSDVVTVDDGVVFNNFLREKSVLLELNKPISEPTTADSSVNTISGYNKCSSPLDQIDSTGSAYYVSSRVINPNQYGQVGSANPVSMHSCTLSFTGELSETPILYGGDCVIDRIQIQKRMQFFNQNLANAGFPDGTGYDYKLYRNIAYPRYWLDSTKYDFSELLSTHVINFSTFSRTTNGKHNLDCPKDDKRSPTRIDDAYMYLSHNTVLDFFVEADYNPNFREKTDHPHYSKTNTNLSQVFRSDRLLFPEEFQISRAFSDLYTTEIFTQQQRSDFDPLNPIPTDQPNSVIYSLPAFNLQEVDGWQYFLPGNYFSFRESDFGDLTAIHKLDQDRVIFLFSKSSPYISIGRDFLNLEQSGRKISIGDGGLFAQDPREIMPTDNNYGACNSRYAFSNTHHGRFYPSAAQGRIINFANSLDDIAIQGISYWCKTYMPIALYNYFPDYTEPENPLSGVGYLTAFDSFYEMVYITKRDYSPKRDYINDITYTPNGFQYRGNPISLGDLNYFNDISWTLSYSPLDKSFVSWHDWHPDLVIQTDNHFMTVKGNTVWKHNEAFDSFCNFYGKDYPFEIEPVSSSGQSVETIRSIEYFMEVYKYKNFGRSRFETHHENFDKLIVWNSDQISPLLELTLGSSNPEENLAFPKTIKGSNISLQIPFFKEEHKYRVNMFWDAVKDRGEFSHAEFHLFPTDESGYRRVINQQAIDINKPEDQRKKFRHYFNHFMFAKALVGPHKFIVKFFNIKKLLSQR